jgi:transcriptional regulator NrdR family protein
MLCPYCGSKTQVRFSKSYDDKCVQRVRYCPQCKRAENSTEVYDSKESGGCFLKDEKEQEQRA